MNVQDEYGWTALIIASENGYLDIIKYLIDSGALTELKNNEGKTAKDLAATDDIRALFE